MLQLALFRGQRHYNFRATQGNEQLRGQCFAGCVRGPAHGHYGDRVLHVGLAFRIADQVSCILLGIQPARYIVTIAHPFRVVQTTQGQSSFMAESACRPLRLTYITTVASSTMAAYGKDNFIFIFNSSPRQTSWMLGPRGQPPYLLSILSRRYLHSSSGLMERAARTLHRSFISP